MAVRLDDLPESQNKFWDGKKQILTPKGKDCRHEFIRISGREVKCKSCPIGFILSANSTLKDGHIYIEGKLAV